MTEKNFVLKSEERSVYGRAASRRLRRTQNKLPAIIYGGQKDPLLISLDYDYMNKVLSDEAFYTRVVTIKVGNRNEQVILKDIQYHPAKNKYLHLDFMRVNMKEAISVRIPLHFTNQDTCPGVKEQGGLISHIINDVEVRGLPAAIPQFIEVDMGSLHVGETVRLTDLQLPQDVEFVSSWQEGDQIPLVATVMMPKGGMEEEEIEADAESAVPDESEPEDKGPAT